MSDRIALPLLMLLALGLIALALVWPQGLGRRSPAPFGHPLAAAPPPHGAGPLPPAAAPEPASPPAPLRGDLPATAPGR